MSDRPDGASHEEEVNSRIQTSEQGTSGRSQAQQPPPPPTVPPVTTPVAPPLTYESSKRTPIEKLRKFGAEEFRGSSDDNPVKAEYWLKSLERVFKQMMCSSEDYFRCAVSLLKEEAYNWWETIEAVVPAYKLTWEFFQNEFKKKYVGKRYLDKKNREFLDLRQWNKTVAEYEREFVYLSRYARDVVPTEEKMCIRFEEGLNDEIRMMIGGTEIREFVVLSDRAQKMEEVYNKKMQRERRGKEVYKRSFSRPTSTFSAKKFRDDSSRPVTIPERLNKSKTTQQDVGVTKKPVASVSSVQNIPRLRCKNCGRFHIGECWGRAGACYKCGGTDHFIRDCPQLLKEDREQGEKQANTPQKGKRSGQSSAAGTVHSGTRDTAARSETRVPARTYAIRAKEEASAPDVIAVSEKKMTVESTDLELQVTNPLGQKFDVILGMDWLIEHDAIVNCREKRIDLKCQTGEIVSAEFWDKKNDMEQLSVVNEFTDVFPKELPGLPPDREVEFTIDTEYIILGRTCLICEKERWFVAIVY
ncbi:uncharacterized protein [Gossypium hirsutum]|uniref:CCHC-type domain-containing protein n=1 Tax=Gossypium hirsutum TaxID=3635 RepID=A0ABM2ZDD2_GOSHI|nr:uncharacterized protein LOC107930997 [Gossypium hirsutum]